MRAAHIVIIEDNSADVFLVELALKENGIAYELTRFKDGQEAVEALCTSDGAPAYAFHLDAILLDLNTPRSDGFEVLEKLRRNPHLNHVPIAILTSSQAIGNRHRTSLLGAVRYIEKPSQLDEFLKTVGQAIKELLRPLEL